MLDSPSEAELIDRARRGEEAAWEALVHRHQQPAFRFAYLLLGDPDDAKDVTQEAFIRTYRHLHTFDLSRPLRPWLMRIVSNLARNRKRSLARYWRALERAAGSEPVANPGHDPEQTQELWQAIRQLNPVDQQMIYLRYFLEVPEAEMAAILEVRPGTVKSRLHRALRRLHQVIDRQFPGLKAGMRA